MREFLFRGINNVTKEWIIGNLFQRDEQAFIMADNCVAEVIPETVGQFTGLTDRNGRKIFEGDILKTEKDIGYVSFTDGTFTFHWNSIFRTHKSKNDRVCILRRFALLRDLQICGNVHDDSEMV